MRVITMGILIGLVLCFARSNAAADDVHQVTWTVVVTARSDHTLSCSIGEVFQDSRQSLLRVVGSSENDPPPSELSALLDQETSPPLPLTKGNAGYSLSRLRSEFAGRTLYLKLKGKTFCAQTLSLPQVAQSSGQPDATGKQREHQPEPLTEAPSVPPISKDRYFELLDRLALNYLRIALKIQEHGVSGGALGKTYDLYHLPSGRPAFPLSSHISEKDRVRLHIVTPEDASAKVIVSTCNEVPEIRILGSLEQSRKDLETSQLGRSIPTAPIPTTQFALFDHEQTLRCAGTLSYRVLVTTLAGESSSPTSSITIEPVYLLSLGISLIFDFGKPSRIALQDVDSSTNDPQRLLIARREFSGFRPLLSFGLHPCRANPRDWSACDWLVPIIALDPSRVTQGFAVGLGISPYSGIALQGGLSLFQSEVLDDSVSVQVGDRWTKPGDPPKRAVFNSDSVGGFIGVSLSSDLYRRLWPK
jgi:hypothetical protein